MSWFRWKLLISFFCLASIVKLRNNGTFPHWHSNLLIVMTFCDKPPFLFRWRQLTQNMRAVDIARLLFVSVYICSPHECSIVFFFLFDNSLQLRIVALKEAEYMWPYPIFLSFCCTCQLRFLNIDFCLWSSLANLSPYVFNLLPFLFYVIILINMQI